MTRRTARTLHALTYTAEGLAVTGAVAVVLMVGVVAWQTVTAWPWPLRGITTTALASGLARLALEAPTAWRAVLRWHRRPHRQINDRTEPAIHRGRDGR